MAQRFPAARVAQVYPATLLYARGQYDSTEAFWRTKTNDPNVLVKLGAMNAMTSLSLLRGHLKQAVDLGSQLRKFNASRGVPPNPMADSLVAAAIEIWWLGRNEQGVRGLDAALAGAPLKNLPDRAAALLPVRGLLLVGRPSRQGSCCARAIRE